MLATRLTGAITLARAYVLRRHRRWAAHRGDARAHDRRIGRERVGEGEKNAAAPRLVTHLRAAGRARGENAKAIGSLPIAALPLAPEDARWLAKVGVRTVATLRELPKEGLAERLGARAREILSLADGDDRAPITAYVPPEIPEEEATLEYGIEGTQALTFVAKTLTDRLAARLQGRAVAAAQVELELKLDRAVLAANDAGNDVLTVNLDLPAPLSNAADLLAALRPKIERIMLAAPVLSAKLRAPNLVQQRAAALSLFEPQPRAERALPRLVAELVSDLGKGAVAMLTVGDSWGPTIARSSFRSAAPTPKRRRH